MAKYNLSVAVMQDDEPIMFLASKDFETTEYIKKFPVYENLKLMFPTMDWILWSGQEYEGMQTDYCEYSCSPDREREDMELLAIWQKLED